MVHHLAQLALVLHLVHLLHSEVHQAEMLAELPTTCCRLSEDLDLDLDPDRKDQQEACS